MLQSATPADKPAVRRRTYRLLGLALILLTLALALPAAALDSGWAKQSSPSSTVFNGVAFVDAIHGWVVGGGSNDGAGVILATSDGGATWRAHWSGTSGWLIGVAFSDAAHGWAVGYDNDTGEGTILATSNGGATWSAQKAGRGEDLESVPLSDSIHGWAMGNNLSDFGVPGVSLAINGGAAWSKQSSGTTYLKSVAFPDATHGWAVGSGTGGVILATTDGGVTWFQQSPGSDAQLTAVAFPDVTHGWAVGSGGAILATTDGGATWGKQYPKSPETQPVPTITKLKPASAKRGATVTITGNGFGAAQGTGSVKFGAKTCATYSSWSATQIKCKVPTEAKYGAVTVTVTTAAGTSNAMSFTVKR